MAKNNESEESLKEPIKSLVKEIVGKIVYKMVKASAKKTVAELKKRLKEEAINKIEEKLKEAAENKFEKQLTKSSQKLQKEIVQDNPQGSDYVSRMQQSFEKDCHRFLSSLKGMSSLAKAIIICICILAVGAGIYLGIIRPDGTTTTPSPQPDLVITSIEPEWLGGERAIIHYTIVNQGEATAGESYSCLYIVEDLLMADYVEPLAPGEVREESFLAHSFSEEDVYSNMWLCTDDYDQVDENNEENNCVTVATFWTEPSSPRPDLVISWIEADWTGGGIVISYKIANQGEAEAGESYAGMIVAGEIYLVDEVAPLGPGEERELHFYAYDLLSEYDDDDPIELCVDIYGNIDESNEENNCATP